MTRRRRSWHDRLAAFTWSVWIMTILSSSSSSVAADARFRGSEGSNTRFLSEDAFHNNAPFDLPNNRFPNKRRLKENDRQTSKPTVAPTAETASPSYSPSEKPSSGPTLGSGPTRIPTTTSPTQSNQSPIPTKEPTMEPSKSPSASPRPTKSSSPTVDPIVSMNLKPFSVKVQGNLRDEVAFRTNLEVYMYGEMVAAVASVQDVAIEQAPPTSSRRSLQEAYMLDYIGVAYIDTQKDPNLTQDQLQIAQALALENVDGLQHFLDLFSGQELIVQQVAIDGRDTVLVNGATSNQSNTAPSKKKGGKVVAGVLVAVLLLAVATAVVFYIYIRKRPPPPPPLELEIIPEVDIETKGTDLETFGSHEHNEQMEIVLKDKGSSFQKPESALSKREKKKAWNGKSMSPNPPPPPPSSLPPPLSPPPPPPPPKQAKQQYSKPIVDFKNPTWPTRSNVVSTKTTTKSSSTKDSSEEQVDGSVEVDINGNKERASAVLDLTKPPSHVRGIQSAPVETPRPVVPDSADSVVDSQSVVDDDTAFGMLTIKSHGSMTDSESMAGFSIAGVSMAGFSLAGDHKHDSPNINQILSSPQWSQRQLQQKGKNDFVTEKKTDGQNDNHSDAESSGRRVPGSRYIARGGTGNRKPTNALFDKTGSDDDDDRNVEVRLPHMFVDDGDDEEIYSSYKEEESFSIVSGHLSEASDSEGVYLSPGKQSVLPKDGDPEARSPYGGALGIFHRYEDEEDDRDGLPMLPPVLGHRQQIDTSARPLRQIVGNAKETENKRASKQEDCYSDVPSDELNGMLKNGKNQDQDLTGFPVDNRSKAKTVSAVAQQGLAAAWSPTATRGGNDKYTNDGSPPSASEGSHFSSNSWDNADDPDVSQFLKERRRIKRAARKHRAERKQPPVTMEV